MDRALNLGYKDIFDDSADAIIIADGLSERILDVNKSLCKLIGYNKNRLIGYCLSDFFDPENYNDIFNSSRQNVFSEREIKTNSGQFIPVDLNFDTFHDEDNLYIITTLRSAGERIKYENEIISMNEKLNVINEGKDKLFAIIAHDLKNPMMALMGLSEILCDETEIVTPEEITEFSGIIKDLSINTYDLLENLLTWTEVQTKNIEIEMVRFQLASIVEKNINVLKPSAELKSIKIINKVDSAFMIIADKVMINTIVRNLISNSIKFSSEKTSITIAAAEDEMNWNIHIVDEGIGMEDSYVKNIFNTDIHTSRYGTNKEKGTGLGLILCNEFVKLHGGNIKVNSKLDEGTEFIIQLPKK